MMIPFRGFDPHKEVRGYRHGHLPHWRQDGCAYFITFRLADSLPQPVLEALLLTHERTTEEGQRNFRIEFEKYLDQGAGSCVLRNSEARKVVEEMLLEFPREKAQIGDFVIMPNHVHLLVQPQGANELEDILRQVKGATSVVINRQFGRAGALWQRQSYDRIVRDVDHLFRCRNYIARNPIKAKLRADEFTHYQAEWEALGD